MKMKATREAQREEKKKANIKKNGYSRKEWVFPVGRITSEKETHGWREGKRQRAEAVGDSGTSNMLSL